MITIVHPTRVLIVPFLVQVTGTNSSLGDSQWKLPFDTCTCTTLTVSKSSLQVSVGGQNVFTIYSCICSTMENAFPQKPCGWQWAFSLWSRLCACGSALGLSGSCSCGSGLTGSCDMDMCAWYSRWLDHVRVIQPVAGPGRPYATRGLEPTTSVFFVGTHFPMWERIFHRATNAAGKTGRITGSSSHPASLMLMSLFVLAETKNRSQAPYIPLGRYSQLHL
jgi:hypothetical protein